jgi:H+/gluconate symporter-like permease
VELGHLIFAAAVTTSAELPPSTTPEQLKALATEHGLLGLLLAIAIGAIGVLFTLYVRSNGTASKDKQAALDAQALAHEREVKTRDDNHAKDRAEWHAATTMLQEARVGLIREVLVALQNATAQIQLSQATIAERTTTSHVLQGKIEDLIASIQSMRASSSEDVASIRKRINDLAEAVEKSCKSGAAR